MSKLSDMIQISEVFRDVEGTNYKAEVKLMSQGTLGRQFQNEPGAFDKLVGQLKCIILETVYREILEKLDGLRLECFKDSQSGDFGEYQANMKLAEKLHKLSMEIRGLK